MKRNLHKAIACLVLLVVCLSAYSQTLSINGVKYSINNGSAIVTGFESSLSGDVVIPTSVEYKGTSYNVTEVKDHAFIRANDITSVTVPEGVSTIGQMAFTFCNNLTRAKLPQSATKLDKNIFARCSKLESVTMSNNIEVIPEKMFQDCTSLTSLTIPGKLKKIENGAFYCCNNIKVIKLPDGLMSIGEYAFGGCNHLATINIPSTVTEIGNDAFSNCGITELFIPKGIVSGVNRFGLSKCRYLKTVTVDKENPKYYTEDNIVYCKNDTLVAYPGGIDVQENIPSNVKAIAPFAFDGKSGPFNIKFPSQLSYIGEFAFSNCGITGDIDIPGTVKKISGNAFAYDVKLTSVRINEGTNEIDNYAFYSDGNITAVHLPSTINKIGRAAFHACSNLSDITIPSNVTEIGEFAFGALPITEITIPKNLKKIPQMAFDNCKNLKTVNLPKELETIEYAAFRDNISLTAFDLPANVKEVNSGAFIGCNAMKSININESNEAYTSVDGVLMSKDKTRLVAYPGGLTEGYTVPAYVKYVNGEAFHDALIGSVEFSEGVEEIGRYAFGGCQQLKDITIPATIKSIAPYAFTNCGILESVSVKCKEPVEITGDAFSPMPETTLYVPTGSKAKYEAATGWKNFKNIVEKDFPAGISASIEDSRAEEVSRYAVDGRVTNKAYKGLCIIKMSNGKIIKVMAK